MDLFSFESELLKSKLYWNKWPPVLVALGQAGDWADAGIIEVIRVDTVME